MTGINELLAAEAAHKAAEICAVGDRDLYTEETTKKDQVVEPDEWYRK